MVTLWKGCHDFSRKLLLREVGALAPSHTVRGTIGDEPKLSLSNLIPCSAVATWPLHPPDIFNPDFISQCGLGRTAVTILKFQWLKNYRDLFFRVFRDPGCTGKENRKYLVTNTNSCPTYAIGS